MSPLRRTVRFRITAIATVAVAVVLSVTATALVLVQHRRLTANIDRGLRQTAGDLRTLLATASDPPAAFADRGPEDFAQLIAGGRVIAATPNLKGRGPLRSLPAGRTETIVTRHDLPHTDDAFRVLAQTVTTPDGPAVLIVGTSRDEVSDSVAALLASLAVALPAVVLLLAALVWWLSGRALAPVEEIRREVSAISSSELSRRVPVPESGDEIARLATTMNQMLGRLQSSLEREQRFVADASHELRTPLTRMRTEIEVTAQGRERETLESVRAEVVEMQSLVDDLLYLARAGAQAEHVGTATVDLDDIVLREADRVRREGRLHIDVSGVDAVAVTGHAGRLARAVRNLVVNAERYARTSIRLSLQEADGHAVFTIADDGPGVPAAMQERVFERFGRADDARSTGTGGVGLGLSIVRDIVAAHGGTVQADPDRAGGSFTVRLPLNR